MNNYHFQSPCLERKNPAIVQPANFHPLEAGIFF